MIKVEVRRQGRWIAARRIALSVNPAGRFFSLLRLRAGARYRVSATYTGSAGYRPSWSGYRLLALRAR